MSKRIKKQKEENDLKKIEDVIKKEEGKIWILSIDPGKINFSFIIEEIDIEKIDKIKNIPKSKRFDKNGPTDDYNKILNDMFCCGKTVIVENNSINFGVTSDKYIDPKIFINLTDVLDKYQKYFDQVDYIVIEQQMSFGKRKNNTLALKIAQHAFSYFTIMYRDWKKIQEFGAYYKTKILGAPEKMDKPARKKWAIQKASEIWILRDDFKTASKVESAKKKDDMSDTLVMTQAFIYLHFIDKLI